VPRHREPAKDAHPWARDGPTWGPPLGAAHAQLRSSFPPCMTLSWRVYNMYFDNNLRRAQLGAPGTGLTPPANFRVQTLDPTPYAGPACYPALNHATQVKSVRGSRPAPGSFPRTGMLPCLSILYRRINVRSCRGHASPAITTRRLPHFSGMSNCCLPGFTSRLRPDFSLSA
jgi:hypothetical protein